MLDYELPFRQVHLDFHTSEKIAGIGAAFDPDEFADTLQRANVNSINCFARGHHGYVYYDTPKFPERRHPHLTRNLLKEQIEACHQRNIKVPIYITVQWDHFTAMNHPEWLVVDEFGAPKNGDLYQPGFYRFLCLNSPYVDFLKAFTRDVLETLPVDGTWFDIVQAVECSCQYCRAGMLENGLEPSNPAHRKQYAMTVLENFKKSMTRFVRQYNSDCVIFYNAGHIGPAAKPVLDTYTHFELESLPSGEWGYLHFPMTQRYCRTLGIQTIGMTGKFHTSWGDFHSFKNRAALEFECFQMLALNAKCCVGDQLHPSGKICRTTYDLIGSVYESVKEKEPWCTEATPLVEIGVLTPEEFTADLQHLALPASLQGVTRMLQEARYQFDIIDSAQDFNKYSLLILPDEIPLNEQLAKKFRNYLSRGGKVIATFRAGLNLEQNAFALAEWGGRFKGEAPFSPDFLLPRPTSFPDLAETEYVMYLRGLEIELTDGEVLADVVAPGFNRTYDHFCSHRHTPSSGKITNPGIIRRGNVIYFSHPIFTQYHQNAPFWCKKLLVNAVKILLPEALVEIDGPSSLHATLNEQPAANRAVLHLLHYIPERRSATIDIIEDVVPLFHVAVSIKPCNPVKRILSVPQEKEIPFQIEKGRIFFTVSKIFGHQMICLDYA